MAHIDTFITPKLGTYFLFKFLFMFLLIFFFIFLYTCMPLSPIRNFECEISTCIPEIDFS